MTSLDVHSGYDSQGVMALLREIPDRVLPDHVGNRVDPDVLEVAFAVSPPSAGEVAGLIRRYSHHVR
eukprot:7885445-Heterocapsa_arctica.AAC.1